jgi:hypothetical protein
MATCGNAVHTGRLAELVKPVVHENRRRQARVRIPAPPLPSACREGSIPDSPTAAAMARKAPARQSARAPPVADHPARAGRLLRFPGNESAHPAPEKH